MSQADVSKLVSKLRYNLKPRRKLQSPAGPQGRHDKIRKTVTALFKYERIELNTPLGDESRGYAERLISDAIKYGACHKETMKMASYWILEGQIVHKLFKVLAPRYQKFPLSYTKMWRVPSLHSKLPVSKCVLELRNNIYPPLGPDRSCHKNLIHNILLGEAKKAFEKEKALQFLQKCNGVLPKSLQNQASADGHLEPSFHPDQEEKEKNNLDDLHLDKLDIQSEETNEVLPQNLKESLEISHSETSGCEGTDTKSCNTAGRTD